MMREALRWLSIWGCTRQAPASLLISRGFEFGDMYEYPAGAALATWLLISGRA